MRMSDLVEHLVVSSGHGELVKVSTIYPDRYVTAEVVYPIPPRTTVRAYGPDAIDQWRPCSTAQYRRYVKAWEAA